MRWPWRAQPGDRVGRGGRGDPVIGVLSGGVGAARLLVGLQQVVEPAQLTALVNVGDDTVLHGLTICPDLDTITYTLAGAIDLERGWGLAGETWRVMAALERFASVRPPGSGAGATWFGLGDRDLATHLYRTHRLGEGATLTEVTAEIAAAYGVGVRLLPITDDPLQTRLVVAGEGEIGFQEYFVARRHQVPITGVRFAGADRARVTAGGRRGAGRRRPVGDRSLEPDRVDRPAARRGRRARARWSGPGNGPWRCRPSSGAGRSRARPTACWPSSVTRSASWGSRSCTGTWRPRW